MTGNRPHTKILTVPTMIDPDHPRLSIVRQCEHMGSGPSVGGQAFFAYSTNYLIDVDNAIIVDVEATTAIRQAEILAAKRMIERSLEHFDLYPERLIGDSAYGSAEMLN